MEQTSTEAVDAAGTDANRYVIDGRASRFTVRAFATGMLSAMGHDPTIGVRDISGEMKFDPDKAGSRLAVDRHQGGFACVEDDISAKDIREMESLMNQEVLETGEVSGDSV